MATERDYQGLYDRMAALRDRVTSRLAWSIDSTVAVRWTRFSLVAGFGGGAAQAARNTAATTAAGASFNILMVLSPSSARAVAQDCEAGAERKQEESDGARER